MRSIDFIIVYFFFWCYTTGLLINSVEDVIGVLVFSTAIFYFATTIYNKKHETVLANELLDTIYELSIDVVDILSFMFSKLISEWDARIGVFGYSLSYDAQLPYSSDIETYNTENTDRILKYVCASIVDTYSSDAETEPSESVEDTPKYDDTELELQAIDYDYDYDDVYDFDLLFASKLFKFWHKIPVWDLAEDALVYTWDDETGDLISEQDEEWKDVDYSDYGPEDEEDVEWQDFIRREFAGYMGYHQEFYSLEYIDCSRGYELNLYHASHVAFSWPTDWDHIVDNPTFKEYCQTEVRRHIEYINDWHSYKILIKKGRCPKY